MGHFISEKIHQLVKNELKKRESVRRQGFLEMT